MVIGEQMAVMCASDREGIPMIISLVSLFSNLGDAIGYAVSAAIYATLFPRGCARPCPRVLRINGLPSMPVAMLLK